MTQITLGILVLALVILLAACVSDPGDAKVSGNLDALRATASKLHPGCRRLQAVAGGCRRTVARRLKAIGTGPTP